MTPSNFCANTKPAPGIPAPAARGDAAPASSKPRRSTRGAGRFAGTLVLRALIAGRGYDPADQVWSQALVGAAAAVPGALIAARRPRHPVGWLLLLAGVWLAVPAFGYEYARYAFGVHPGALPGGDWWLWASRREGAISDYALPFLLLLFPTGYLLSRRWRPVAWLAFAAVTVVNLVQAFLAGAGRRGELASSPRGPSRTGRSARACRRDDGGPHPGNCDASDCLDRHPSSEDRPEGCLTTESVGEPALCG
jgi:hypothetical protein